MFAICCVLVVCWLTFFFLGGDAGCCLLAVRCLLCVGCCLLCVACVCCLFVVSVCWLLFADCWVFGVVCCMVLFVGVLSCGGCSLLFDMC